MPVPKRQRRRRKSAPRTRKTGVALSRAPWNLIFRFAGSGRAGANLAISNSSGRTRFTDKFGMIENVPAKWIRHGFPLHIHDRGRTVDVIVRLDARRAPLPIEIPEPTQRIFRGEYLTAAGAVTAGLLVYGAHLVFELLCGN